jgi:hypothetical protein
MLRQNIDVGFGVEVTVTDSIKENRGRCIKPALSAIDYTRA